MSVSAAGTASGVQPPANGGAPEGAPAAGESQGIAGLGLYDLSAAPEELRPFLEQELKKFDGEVTKKFQEHADFRKKYEPLEQIEGLSDMPAQELAELIQFREVASDPEQFEQWWESVGKQFGFFEDDGEPGSGGEPEGGEEAPAWAQQLTDRLDRLEQGLEPVQKHLGEQERKDAVQAAEREIAAEFAKLEQEHGDLEDEAKNDIGRLALVYDGEPGAIGKAFADYQRITGQAQGELADSKLGQPRPALTGGSPATEPEKFEGLNDPKLKAAAKARLAAGG